MWKPRRAKPGGATRFAILSREVAPRDCGGSPAWERAPTDRDSPELRRGTLAGTTAGVGTAPDGALQDTGAGTVAHRRAAASQRLSAHPRNRSLHPVRANGPRFSCNAPR